MLFFYIFSSVEYADANKQILTTSLTRHCKYFMFDVSTWHLAIFLEIKRIFLETSPSQK